MFYGLVTVLYLFVAYLDIGSAVVLFQGVVVVVFACKVLFIQGNLEHLRYYIETKDLKREYRILVMFLQILGCCHVFVPVP